MAWKLSLLEISLLLFTQGIILCDVTAEELSRSCLNQHEDSNLSNASTCLGCFNVSCYRGYFDFENESMTIAACVNECGKMGFQYAGLTYSNMCRCGILQCNETDREPAKYCGLPCYGNRNLLCGGVYFISVYSVDLNRTWSSTAPDILLAHVGNDNRNAEEASYSREHQSDPTTEIELLTDLLTTASTLANTNLPTSLPTSEKPGSSVIYQTDRPFVIALAVAVVLLFVLLLLVVIRYEWLRSRAGRGNSAKRGEAVCESANVQLSTHTYQALHASPKLVVKENTFTSHETLSPSVKVSTPCRQPSAIVNFASSCQDVDPEYENMRSFSLVVPEGLEPEFDTYDTDRCSPDDEDTYFTTRPQLEHNESTYQNCRRIAVVDVPNLEREEFLEIF